MKGWVDLSTILNNLKPNFGFKLNLLNASDLQDCKSVFNFSFKVKPQYFIT